MKSSHVLVAALAVSLAACSSNRPKVDTVRSEALEKSMVTPEIEVTHSGCSTLSRFVGRTCRIVRIDSTATAPSNGGSNVLRSQAYKNACVRALGQVSDWKGQQVQNSRIVETTSTSNELSNSRENQTNADRAGNNESATRENTNDTKWVITDIIRTNSAHFLRGWKSVSDGSPVIGSQEVKCVMRWDALDDSLLQTFNNQ